MSNEYSITIKVANGGAGYIYQEDKNGHKKGDVTTSKAGHMWLSGSDGVTRTSAGFESEKGVPYGAGSLSKNDDQAYQHTAYEMTIKVTKEQYDAFIKFSKNPEEFGFNHEEYKLLNNSCIDYAWAGLKAIGYNPEGFEGALLPKDNIDKVRQFVRAHGAEVIQDGLTRNGDHMESGTACEWLDPYLQSKVSPNEKDPSFFQKLLEGDLQLSKLFSQGKISQGLYNDVTKWHSDTLRNNFNNLYGNTGKPHGSSDFKFGLDASGLRYNPIGAFYESTTTAVDTSASIAQKTLVLFDSQQKGLTESTLAGRDINKDGKLTGTELSGISAWADLNENGVMDAGELQTLSQAGLNQVRGTDYGFYTKGNSRVAPPAPVAPVKRSETSGVPARVDRTQAVPASNFRTLRDTDNLFVTAAGYIEWAPTQVKINSKNQSYLIGTDGSDSFNASYYANYNHFNSALLVNFLAGGGDDKVGGSARNDSIWGGAGNDLLFGYAGNDKLYGEEGDDELQGQDGADYLDGGVGVDRLFGGNGNDVLKGGDGADILLGDAGDDSLYGGNGADYLTGGQGNDYLDGGRDDDELRGDAGNDILLGGAGADVLQGGEGADQLLGEDGNDRLFGQVGNDTLWGGAGNDILMGFTAINETKQSLLAGETDNDTLYGGAGTDYLYGGLGDDYLDGGDDSDVLAGNEGNDTLFGGAGDDEMQGNAGNDLMMGGAGNDKLFGQVGDDVLWGGDGNDILLGFTGTNEAKQSLWSGESDNDTLYGGAGNDLILGGLGDDTLLGESGADELQGGAGNDLLYGGTGNDKLFGQVGNDVLYGGDGDDILVGFTAYNETQQRLRFGESDNDWLYGGAGNDILLGGVGNDYLDGGAGADLMEGGAGDDTYIVNSVNDSTLERTGEGYDVVVSSCNYLLNANVEELRLVEGLEIHATGNALDNKLVGNSHNNILDGVTGKDTMIGGAGDDTYYVDNLGDKTIELAGEGVDTVQSSISHSLADNVENLILLDFGQAEKGLVDGQATLVYGYPKANELDYMQGDAVVDFEGTCALTAIANLLTQADRPITEKDVIGVAVDNNWTVSDPKLPAYQRGGSNFIQQQALLDSFGLRNDLLAGYNEQGVANLVRSGRGVILAVNAGQLWGDPAYIGNGAVNHMVTVTGAVYSEASGELMGFYIADSGRQKVSDMTRYVSLAEFRRAANVRSGYAIYTLEPLKLWNEDINGTGNSLNNLLVGNRGDNTLSGGAGNDTLSGGAGTDRLEGGTGSDTYLFNLGDGHDSIVEVEAMSSSDVLKFGAGIVASDLEIVRAGNNLLLKHRNGQDLVSLIDWFTTSYGDSNYHRLSRVEFADGSQWSRDELMRLLTDSAGDNTYEVSHRDQFIFEAFNAGTDQVNSSVSYTLGANLENLTLTGAAAINGTGNAGDNVLIGNVARNVLTGGAGNDLLNGGLGADTLIGGAGDDTYVVDNVGDRVSEAAGGGVDQVNSSVSYTLGAGVENLSLTGSAMINGTGNAGDNVIIGNDERNVITGGAGKDLLMGGAGGDLYMVGRGSEHAAVGEINDTSGSQDELRFSSSIKGDTLVLGAADTGLERVTIGTGTGYTAISSATTALNVDASAVLNGLLICGNAGDNRLIGTAFDDYIDGRQGGDIMNGGDGHDLYMVGSVNDQVIELADQGTDTVLSTISYTLGAHVENLLLTGGAAINATGNDLSNGISGNSASNVIHGGLGDDYLDGEKGNDTYIFGRGDGFDTVMENDTTLNNQDTLQFLDGIGFDQLWFSRTSNSLEVSIIGSTDKVVVKDWYVGTAHHVERFKTADGKTLMDSQVQSLVDAMAAFAPPSAGQMMLSGNYRAALEPVLAANWQ